MTLIPFKIYLVPIYPVVEGPPKAKFILPLQIDVNENVVHYIYLTSQEKDQELPAAAKGCHNLRHSGIHAFKHDQKAIIVSPQYSNPEFELLLPTYTYFHRQMHFKSRDLVEVANWRCKEVGEFDQHYVLDFFECMSTSKYVPGKVRSMLRTKFGIHQK